MGSKTKLPNAELKGRLFYLDASFLVSYTQAVAACLEEDADEREFHRLDELQALVEDCITTQTALVEAKTDAERIAIKGGAALKPDWEKVRDKLRKKGKAK